MALARFRLPAHTISVSRSARCIRPVTALYSPARSTTESAGRDVAQDAKLVRDAAKLGVLIFLKAIAATKVYQASTVRAMAASTVMVMQAVSPSSPDISTLDHTVPAPQAPTVDLTQHSTNILPASSFVEPVPAPTVAVTPHATLTINETLLEAALWTDELRHLQTVRAELQADLQQRLDSIPPPPAAVSRVQPTSRNVKTPASSTPVSPTTTQSATAHFVSHGPEFCPLTQQVENCSEVVQLRSALKQQIRALSLHLLSACARASPSPVELQYQFLDRVLDNAPPPVQHNARSAQVKELQKKWSVTAQDVTHLHVRRVQLQQLPAQPKARVTVAYAKEQVLNYLHERQAYLAQDE